MSNYFPKLCRNPPPPTLPSVCPLTHPSTHFFKQIFVENLLCNKYGVRYFESSGEKERQESCPNDAFLQGSLHLFHLKSSNYKKRQGECQYVLLEDVGTGRFNVHQIDYLGGILITRTIYSTSWPMTPRVRYSVSDDQGQTDSHTLKQCIRFYH